MYYNPKSLALSTDRGLNWVYPDTGLAEYDINAIIRSGPNLLAGGDPNNTGFGLYTSSNSGIAWGVSSAGINGNELEIFGFVNVGTTLLAATNAHPYISTDRGITWQRSAQGINYSQQVVVWAIGTTNSKVFIHCTPNDPGNLGIYISDDTGLTWHPALDSTFPVRGVVQCFTSLGDNLFAATDSLGVCLTTDFGAHWTSENLGLGDSNVISLAIQGNELLAGTATSGVWRRPLAEMIPSLSVAGTNPPLETISVYPDPASSIVTVSCPNLTGTTEASLVSETGASVWHRTISTNDQPFQLDFTGVANGAYRLQLQAGSVNQTSKIVLQR